MSEALIIKNWDEGVADSPHKGFGLMRNVDIETFPGAIKTGLKPQTMFRVAYSSTFTANAGDDLCTAATSSLPSTAAAVTLTTTGTLPAGLVTGTTYFIQKISTNTFKFATTVALANAGTPDINITDAGTGVHTVTTTNPGTVYHIVDVGGTKFCQDSNGRVWYEDASIFNLLVGNTLTGSAGNGLVTFENSDGTVTYLFAFRNAAVDVINVTATTNRETPVWTNAWGAMNSGAGSGNSHHTIVGQDNIIYFCDDRYVGSIRENSGSVFDPANSATYTFNNQALDMPQGEINQWLEQLGTNLLVAGGTYNFVYPWDRISSSYNLPLAIQENFPKRLKNIGNIVYILAGQKGGIYTTQGTYIKKFKQLPYQMINQAGSILSNVITWGGIGEKNGSLLFGVAGQTSANNGVYLLDPDGTLILDNQPSTGAGNVTAIYSAGDFYTFGYASGADNFNAVARYASYEAVAQSPLYTVATKAEKTNYNTLELQIAKPVAGHVRISYRTDTSSAFTNFTNGAFTTDTSNTSYECDIGLIDIENIQIQVEMDGSTELMEVRLLP